MSKVSLPRYGFVFGGGMLLLLAGGFVFRVPLVLGLWPWADSRLSYIFVGSIIAAMAVAFVWIGISGEWGAAPAGAVTGIVIASGMASYLLVLSEHRSLVPYAVTMIGIVAFSIGLLIWSRSLPIRDQRPMPRLVRRSFVVFVLVLLLAATALVLRVPNIFPWALNPDSSVMFGCIFYGDAAYFLYALFFARWNYARAQLLSFLAYDLVLIPVFFGLFGSIASAHRLSLYVYMAVLIYSGGLAIYYLFLHPSTRAWNIQEDRALS